MSAEPNGSLLPDPDADLVRICQAGGPDAELGFEQLMERHRENIRRRAARMLGCEADADEVVQDVFVNVLRFIQAYRPERPFQHWLSVVTLNTCRLEMRRRKSRERRHKAYRDLSLIAEETLQGDPILQRVLATALVGLRESTRKCILLRVLEGMSYADIAAEQQMSVPAAKMRVVRGLRELRRNLTGHLPKIPDAALSEMPFNQQRPRRVA